jgi:hypothetical protein
LTTAEAPQNKLQLTTSDRDSKIHSCEHVHLQILLRGTENDKRKRSMWGNLAYTVTACCIRFAQPLGRKSDITKLTMHTKLMKHRKAIRGSPDSHAELGLDEKEKRALVEA